MLFKGDKKALVLEKFRLTRQDSSCLVALTVCVFLLFREGFCLSHLLADLINNTSEELCCSLIWTVLGMPPQFSQDWESLNQPV